MLKSVIKHVFFVLTIKICMYVYIYYFQNIHNYEK